MINGANIDMPAGPSEVLVIADEQVDPEFVASDLLSQAEHGADSQVILVTPSETLAKQTALCVEQQLAQLPRAEIARKALSHSRILIAKDLAQCLAISNEYAPEHLIVQTQNARELLPQLDNAGSISSVLIRRKHGRLRQRHQSRSANLRLHAHLFQPWFGGFQQTHDRAGTHPARLQRFSRNRGIDGVGGTAGCAQKWQ